MKQNQLIQSIESEHQKKTLPAFRVGDTINLHLRISEGEKERIQMFSGTVIARRGSGLSETVALYRFAHGAGMERVFMIHSPRIAKVELVRGGKVRKSKLYHLRGTSGRASKVKEQIGPQKEAAAAVEETAPAT